MNVVFLDFDGVILPFGKPSLADKAIVEAVKNFNALLKSEPELKIVISSAWRKHGINYCKRFLEGLGIDSEKVVGITNDEYGSRGFQIQCYLNRNKDVVKFVILDDQSDMDHLMMKLVHTNPLMGLTEKDVEQAVAILNSSGDAGTT
jgi:hypothetical protein